MINRSMQPRQMYGLGSLVKKAVKGVKNVIKSPIGKAAILGAVGFGIPGTKLGGLFGRATFGGQATGALGSAGIGQFLMGTPGVADTVGRTGFLDKIGLGAWGSGVHQHPEHPPWPRESGHRVGSLHYESQGARAIDIGGWGPNLFRRKGEKGVDDQTKIIEGIRAFEESKGGLKRAEFAHEGNDPTGGHDDHVHIAYHKGGEVPGTGERMARLLGGEMVIDVDSSGPAKDMLLAINQANSYEGIVNAIRKFAPYEAIGSETITIPAPQRASQSGNNDSRPKGFVAVPFLASSAGKDPFEILYKG